MDDNSKSAMISDLIEGSGTFAKPEFQSLNMSIVDLVTGSNWRFILQVNIPFVSGLICTFVYHYRIKT